MQEIFKRLEEVQQQLLKSKRILVADDDEVVVDLWTILLSDKGCSVDKAYNGQSAVDFAEVNDYRCIILDVRMPIMDGITAAKIIREKKGSVPLIIFYTGLVDDEIKEASKIKNTMFISKDKDIFHDDAIISLIAGD